VLVGGATLVPQLGYWQSAANSTDLHPCPRRAACRCDLACYAASTTGSTWWQTHVTDFDQVSWTSWSAALAAAGPCVSGPGASQEDSASSEMPVPHSSRQCGKSRNRECGQVCQHD